MKYSEAMQPDMVLKATNPGTLFIILAADWFTSKNGIKGRLILQIPLSALKHLKIYLLF